MSELPTALEQALRHRLQIESTDVEGMDAMRKRMRHALEEDAQARLASKFPRSETNRKLRRVVGAAAAVAVAIVATASLIGGSDTVNLVTSDPSPAELVERQLTVDAATVRKSLIELNQDELGGTWSVLSEEDGMLTLTRSSELDDVDDPILRIITPSSNPSPEEVVSSIRSTLFDTVLVDDVPGSIGGIETRAIRLETQTGTTRLAFRVAAGTYVASTGIDRVFTVHITTGQPRTVVFWVEAPRELIDEFEVAANSFVNSLMSD